MYYYLGLSLLAVTCSLLFVALYSQIRQAFAINTMLRVETESFFEYIQKYQQAPLEEKPRTTGWQGWRKFRVVRIEAENEHVKSFYLVPHDGKPVVTFLPGQHIRFKVKVPGHSQPLIRCYSLSNAASDTHGYRVTVKKEGLVSSYFHTDLVENDILDIAAPTGHFYADMTEKSPMVLIAGGVGLTPSLSMISTLMQSQSEAQRQREVWLFFGVRQPSDLIMPELLLKACEQLPRLTCHYFFSEDADPAVLNANNHMGYVSLDVMQKLGAPFDADFYLCGPGIMVDKVVSGLDQAGVDKSRIHFELFGPASTASNRQTDEKSNVDNTVSFDIEFSESKKSANWNSGKGSVLDVAEEAGVLIDSSCRSGTCGSCVTTVLKGEVEYLSEPSIPLKKGTCLPCISIPKGPLRLSV